jgi:DNA-binding phage protein
VIMALTRDFKETIRARAENDPAFRRELLKEGIENFLSGDVETGKVILRDYVNATIGFEELAAATGLPSKSLMRMFGPGGNPTARNIFEVISHLQEREGVRFEVRTKRAS